MRAVAWRLGGCEARVLRVVRGGALFVGFSLPNDKMHEFCSKLTLLSFGLSPVR